jgi:hypothetical protein
MHNDDSHPRKISELLAEFAEAKRNGRVTIAELADNFDERAFGVLMLILSLPNAVGLGAIPGLSTVFGLPQIFFALQMAVGREDPWLPGWLAQRSISGGDFRAMVDKAMPYLLRAERTLKPRIEALTSRFAERLIGILFVVLATIVSLPIPLGNQPPAIAMAIVSLGMIERDGAFVAGGAVVGALATALALVVVLGGAAAIYLALKQVFA